MPRRITQLDDGKKEEKIVSHSHLFVRAEQKDKVRVLRGL